MASTESPATTDAMAIIAKVLMQPDPWWWLGALLIVVGLPAFFWKLPETIKAVSGYHDLHRKTSLKILTERAKMDNAAKARNLKPIAKPKGKKP